MKPVISAIALMLTACDQVTEGPDLHITSEPAVTISDEWRCDGPHHFRISNRGTQTAYTVVLLQTVVAGQSPAPVRIHPGPAAGQAVTALVCQPPVPARSWCVEARLQRMHDSDPADTNPSNNTWCLDSNQD